MELLFGWQTEPTRLGSGAYNQGVARICLAAITFESKWPDAEINFDNLVHNNVSPDIGRLTLHLLHQPRPLDWICKAWIVLDICGDRQLAARLNTLNEHWFQHGARRHKSQRYSRPDQNPGIKTGACFDCDIGNSVCGSPGRLGLRKARYRR